MSKARIFQLSDGDVRLIEPDGFTRTYYVPRDGGYVRYTDSLSADARQACARLARSGATLTATPDTLLSVIRRERRAGMAADRHQFNRRSTP